MTDVLAPLEERRHATVDTRPLPRAERRHGAPDTRVPEKLKMGVFRVNYFLHRQPATAFVCAFSDVEASLFMGVRDGSAQVNRIAYPVEVVGSDKDHDELESMPITKAPPQPAKQFTDAELARLRTMIDSKITVVERRHGGVDTRTLPRTERRVGAPDTRV